MQARRTVLIEQKADTAWRDFQEAAANWRDRWNSRIGVFGSGARQAYERMIRADIRFREAFAQLDDASSTGAGARASKPRAAVNDCSASDQVR